MVPREVFDEVGHVMHYVYILQSRWDGTFYIGITDDLKSRVIERNRNNAKYTSSKSPYKLVWYSGFANQDKAFEFERYLKSSSGFAFRNKHLV